ncbi:MAG: tetratricopeptide repeat protein [Chloroflexota bacterium]
MNVEDVTLADVADRRRMSRRQLEQLAVNQAMQSRWEDAADINKLIVEMVPGDATAHNRLGKAYTELGRIDDAREAYEQALRADAANLIAQRQLDWLSRISHAEAEDLRKRASEKLDPQFFMEETGKTALTVLQQVAGPEVIGTLTAGEQMAVVQNGNQLTVTTVDGIRIGSVEDRLAVRLARLMQTGNQYQAGVVGVDGETVRVIIRETVQSAQNAGRISFAPRTSSESLPRPYVREGLLRRAGGDDEDEDEADVDLQDESTDDDDEDTHEFGFHEGTLDET